MKCIKCHKITSDESIYCSHCGVQMDEAVVEIHREMSKDEKKTKYKILITVALVLIAIFALIRFIEPPLPKIYLNEYVYIECLGYTGNGNVLPRINEERLVSEILNHLEEVEDIHTYHAQEFASSIVLHYELSTKWSNYDTIEISFEINGVLEDELGINFVKDKITLEVTGLIELMPLDPFEYIEIEYHGMSPNLYASASFVYEDTKLENLKISIEPETGIQKGDTIELNIDKKVEEELKSKGIEFTQWSNILTCDGNEAGEFVTRIDQLNEKILEELVEKSRNSLENYCQENSLIYSVMVYEGLYIVVDKETTYATDNNLYIILSIHAGRTEEKMEKIYFPIAIKNLVKYAEDEFLHDENLGLPEANIGTKINDFTYILGYKDIVTMYLDLVEQHQFTATYEVSPELSQE